MMKSIQNISDEEKQSLLNAHNLIQTFKDRSLDSMSPEEKQSLVNAHQLVGQYQNVGPSHEGLSLLGLPGVGNFLRGFSNSTIARPVNSLLSTFSNFRLPELPMEGNQKDFSNKMANFLGELGGTGTLAALMGGGAPLALVGKNALLGALESPENKTEGALLGGALGSLGAGAGSLLKNLRPGSQIPELANLSQQGTYGIRSPQAVKDLLEKAGPDFKVTLGQATGAPSFLERLASTPSHSSFLDTLSPSLTKTDQLASNISESLKSGLEPAAIPENVKNSLIDYHNEVKQEMDSLYRPLEQKAEEAGFSLKERPNMEKVFNQYFSKESEGYKTGTKLAPDIKGLDQIENILNPEKGASFKQARELESDLKAYGREANRKGEIEAGKFYNHMAEALRKDYDEAIGESLPGGLKAPLEITNKFAKENFYDLFKEPIYDVMEGKKEPFSVLKSPENRELLSRLPQDIKHQVFYNEISSGSEPTAKQLLKLANKGNTNYQSLKEDLLSPEMRNQLSRLEAQNELTKGLRKKLEGGGEKAEIPHTLYQLIHKSLAKIPANRMMANYLSNPALLQRYASLNPEIKNTLFQNILRRAPTSLGLSLMNQGNK